MHSALKPAMAVWLVRRRKGAGHGEYDGASMSVVIHPTACNVASACASDSMLTFFPAPLSAGIGCWSVLTLAVYTGLPPVAKVAFGQYRSMKNLSALL